MKVKNLDVPALIKKVKRRRIEMNLTEREFAKRCELSYVYYHQVEQGDKIPADKTIDKLCLVAGLKIMGKKYQVAEL